MQYLQNGLLMIGASALGLVSSVVLVFFIFAALTPSGSAEDWGPAIFFVFFSFCGAILGAITGFVAALLGIFQRRNEPWTPATWTGVVLGLASALVIRFSGVLDFLLLSLLQDLIESKLGLTLFLAAAGCLGGLPGSFVGRGSESVRQAD